MKTLGERVERVLKDRIIDTRSNTSALLLPCKFCGEQNTRDRRVDTEFDYITHQKEEIESFCIRCWLMNLLKRS